MCSGGFDGESGQVFGAGDLHHRVFRSRILAGGVDGLVFFVSAESPDGIVVFQAETHRVDDGVTGHAAFVLGDLSHFFPHGEIGFEVGVLKLDGIWRWLEKPAQNISAQVNSPVDGRSLFVIRKSGEDERMSEESRAGFVRSGKRLEAVVLRFLRPVKFGKPRIEKDPLFGEEAAVVGLLGPNNVINK